MRYGVIVNSNAGTVRRLGAARVAALLNDKLGTKVASLDFVKGKAIEAACRSAAQARPDALIVLGGDGTAWTSCSVAIEEDVPVALLPGGTLNILPKKVWGENSLDDVLELIGRGDITTTSLDMGWANDKPFFVAATFGLIPELTKLREMVRTPKGLESLSDAGAQFQNARRHLFRPQVWYSSTHETPVLRSAGLVVSIGSVDNLLPTPLVEGDAPAVDPRLFECVALRVDTWGDIVRLFVRALAKGDWRSDAKISSFQEKEIAAHAGRQTWVTLDGEPFLMRGPVKMRYHGKRLRAIAAG